MTKKAVVTVDRTGARTVDLRSLLTSEAAQRQMKQIRIHEPTSRPARKEPAGHRG